MPPAALGYPAKSAAIASDPCILLGACAFCSSIHRLFWEFSIVVVHGWLVVDLPAIPVSPLIADIGEEETIDLRYPGHILLL